MRYDLYINNQLCDLDSSSLIVLNYTMEQLTNPTAVKNTYSHEVELPSTERNDIIFSHFYRNDYKVGRANFSPLQQIPFVIYNKLGEIAESGYIKLDEVQVDRVNHTYKVVLYGGLGSFFYMLGYSDTGDALKLSDLRYMQNAEDEQLLTFRVNANTIRTAWNTLSPNGISLTGQQYEVLNFAPMYNGKPSGNFDASTAIYLAKKTSVSNNAIASPIYGMPSDVSQMLSTLLYMQGDNPLVYATKVKLNKEYTEWETKDLRSYLQRPILSVRKFIEAVQRRANLYGYTLNLDSSFFSSDNPYYNDAWLTLPSLQSLTKENKSGIAQLSATLSIDSTNVVQEQELTISLPDETGYEYGQELKKIRINIPEISIQLSSTNEESVEDAVFLHGLYGGSWAYIAWFVQAYAVDSDNNVMGVSEVAVMSNTASISPEEIAISAGFEPIIVGAQTIDYKDASATFRKRLNGICTNETNIELNITNAPNAERVILRVEKKTFRNTLSTTPANIVFSDITNETRPDYFEFDGVANDVYGTAEVSANETVRSGSIIQKSDLLNIGKSPMDILLSYCKLFGLVWHYESDSKTVSLQQRTTFYGNGIAVDLNSRIDRNKSVTIKPYEFDKRFYDFELETQGEWAEVYKDKYGRPYGSQRVNTGYNFDKDSKNLLQDNSLKGGAEVLEQSMYYCNIIEDGKTCPAVFLDGAEYTQYGAEEDESIAVQTPTRSATIEYFNELYGYDYISKLQQHTADNLPIDGGGTLLLYKGSVSTSGTPYKKFRISDDVSQMGILNNNKVCWILEGSWKLYSYFSLPHFVRANGVSLDMGVPQELDNPDVGTEAVQKSIFSQYWQKYLSDRYDQNSRVLTCYVDLRGLQVSNALFRNFYYFDNAVWVLNRITNYSMTTVGTTQCEFVKVQDINNYKG